MIDKAYIAKLGARLTTVEQQLGDPALAANPRKYQEVVREHSRITRVIAKADAFFRLQRDLDEQRALLASNTADPDLKAIAQEEAGDLEKRLPEVERDLLLALLPAEANDARGVIMEIRAGTGGDEAGLFAGDLYRMYTRFAEGRGWKVSVIDVSASDLGGFKEVVFAIEGQDVYKALKYESGCHRVQRVPVTEGSGRIHTSAATVAVFPEAEEVDDIEIKPEEIRLDIFCSSGPGGQSVNTTYSAVRITHLPTGLVAQSQDERSQHRNRDKAMNVLKARLLDARNRENEERMGTSRRSLIGSGDRSEKIRTYNFPQNRLTDHRINFTAYSLDRVMEGAIDRLIEALQQNDTDERLRELMKAQTAA